MTKKDYELIANSVKSVYNDCDADERTVVYELASSLAIDFKDANPRFDRNKFLQACGVEDACPECGNVSDCLHREGKAYR